MPARYTDEFKIENVRQVTINKHSIKETAERLGVHPEFLRSRTIQFVSQKAIEKNKEKDSADYRDQTATQRVKKGHGGADFYGALLTICKLSTVARRFWTPHAHSSQTLFLLNLQVQAPLKESYFLSWEDRFFISWGILLPCYRMKMRSHN